MTQTTLSIHDMHAPIRSDVMGMPESVASGTMDLMKRILILCLLSCWFISQSEAQNLPFRANQFMFYQPLINVAAQSSYPDKSAVIFHRNQWIGLEGSPMTFGGHYSMPIPNQPVTVGLTWFQDQVGAHSAHRVRIPVSYKIGVTKDSYLAFGMAYSFGYLQSDYQSLNANQQNDPNVPSSLVRQSDFDVSSGVYYFRNNFYAGLAANNIMRHDYAKDGPDVIGISQTQLANFNLHVGGAFHQIVNKVYKRKNYRYTFSKMRIWSSMLLNYVYRQPVNATFNMLFENEKAFGLGTSITTSKEVAWLVRVPIKDEWRIGYSYQVSFSERVNVSTHEFMMIFTSNKRPILGKKLIIPRF